MATIARLVGGIKEQLAIYLPEAEIHDLCRQLKHPFRQRQLPPALSVHLLCWQILASVALTGLRHVATLRVSAQAICQARQKLPLPLLQRLVEHVGQRLATGLARWKGHRLILIDGTTLLTSDTPELAAAGGKITNQYGLWPGLPRVRVLAAIDYASGLIVRVIALPMRRQEPTCLTRLFRYLQAGDVILGDRGLVNFAALALLQARKLHGCFRLPRKLTIRGAGRPKGHFVQKLGRQDQVVCWDKGTRPTWMSRQRFAALPPSLRLRQIAFRICRPGFRTQWAWLLTTLLDPVAYPAQEVVELYGQRWHIEVCFRDLKRSLGMRQLAARSVAGMRKELLGCLLIYNLVRQVMAQAAQNQQTSPDRVSFTDALTWLLYARPGSTLPPLQLNPPRVRPTEPRRLKSLGYRFPPLRGPRSQYQQPPPRLIV